MTAYLLLAAVGWSVATRGGTGARELLVVLGMLVVAVIAGRAWPRRNAALWATFGALMCWLVVAGPLRTGVSLETVRVPLLVVIAALTALVVGRLSPRERETAVSGLIVVGCVQSGFALTELAGTVPTELSDSPRVGALLGSPNGLGMLLVATLILTAREFTRRGGWLPAAALLLQGGALLATGSRTAIVVASALLLGYVATHGGRTRGMLAAAGLAIGTGVVVWRTAVEPQQDRPHLWIEALRRIAEHPLQGEGPTAAAYSLAAPGARVTAHAHNELLQWGVEYGLVGVALGLGVVGIALWSARRRFAGDRWIGVAAIALLAAGLTDFTLRITALTLAAAALAALAATCGSPASRYVSTTGESTTGGPASGFPTAGLRLAQRAGVVGPSQTWMAPQATAVIGTASTAPSTPPSTAPTVRAIRMTKAWSRSDRPIRNGCRKLPSS